MTYTSTIRIQSSIDKDVYFTLRKMSWGRRNQFNETMTEPFARMAEARREREFLEEQPPFKRIGELNKTLGDLVPPAATEPEETRQAFLAKVDLLTAEIDSLARSAPAEPTRRIRELTVLENNIDRAQAGALLANWLLTIEGLVLDGCESPTAEQLIDAGPEKIVQEICNEISKRMRLGDTEIKNSESPTTSAAAEAGSGPNTTATSASATSTT